MSPTAEPMDTLMSIHSSICSKPLSGGGTGDVDGPAGVRNDSFTDEGSAEEVDTETGGRVVADSLAKNEGSPALKPQNLVP